MGMSYSRHLPWMLAFACFIVLPVVSLFPGNFIADQLLVQGLLIGKVVAQDVESIVAKPIAGKPITTKPPASPIVSIKVFPEVVRLNTPRRYSHLVVTGTDAQGLTLDLTRTATYKVADAETVVIGDGVVYPKVDGETEILVQAGGHEVAVPVHVEGQSKGELISFQYETLVALSKNNCNSGACHGSPSGKGGFRLSLRAYDPVLDEFTLIREEFNRRVNTMQPEQSLLLKKPLMEVAHGGGRRLREGDPSYTVIRQWIAEGCNLDAADGPKCVKLEVYPPQRVLKQPAHKQQIIALAHFSDGTVRDVTKLVSFSSSDEAVATVDTNGLVTGIDKGETAVLVHYLDLMETSNLKFLKDEPGFQWPSPEENNYVDTLAFAKIKQLQIVPAGLSTDGEFLRRVYLDVIGNLPTREETETFLAESDIDKRAKLIDQLLERPEYATFWALRWGDLLRLNGKKIGDVSVPKFHQWIVASLRDNMPYDEFATELLTATGNTYSNPAANYYRAAQDTNDCTETTAQLFLGIRIQCAKCHNHPFERWTQDNYYGIGAFFTRLNRKKSGNGDELVVWMDRKGEITQPRTGKQIKPWLPLTGTADVPAETDRREALVNWLKSPDNPFFAKAEVNRIWGYVMGRGIVEPVDDFRTSNPSSNDELLAALAKDFIESGFDRKHILRVILNSHTYQLSFETNALNAADEKYFSHAHTRLLSAEQLLDAICHVTGVPEKFKGLPAGTLATELNSPDPGNNFLKVFGQPARETACQCERSSDANLAQALQMINGPTVHSKLRDENNNLRRWSREGASNEEIVERLFLLALSRQPSEEESKAALAHIAAQGDRIAGLEDVCWGLLNAKEFLFQH